MTIPHSEAKANETCRTGPLRLLALRQWCTGLGIVFLALAAMLVRNSVANPETWSSAFHALSAQGTFVPYAGWLAATGLALLVMAAIAGWAGRKR